MRNWVLLLLLSVITGCATATLPHGPDTYALTNHPGVHSVGVVKVIDSRERIRIGTIGGLGVKAEKEELVNLITNHLIHTLNKDLSQNVVRVDDLGSTDPQKTITKYGIDRLLVVKIYNMNLFSFDALLQPAHIAMDLEFALYDQSGKVLFSSFVKGKYKKWMGFNLSDKNLGILIDGVAQDAIHNLFYVINLKDSL